MIQQSLLGRVSSRSLPKLQPRTLFPSRRLARAIEKRIRVLTCYACLFSASALFSPHILTFALKTHRSKRNLTRPPPLPPSRKHQRSGRQAYSPKQLMQRGIGWEVARTERRDRRGIVRTRHEGQSTGLFAVKVWNNPPHHAYNTYTFFAIDRIAKCIRLPLDFLEPLLHTSRCSQAGSSERHMVVEGVARDSGSKSPRAERTGADLRSVILP